MSWCLFAVFMIGYALGSVAGLFFFGYFMEGRRKR